MAKTSGSVMSLAHLQRFHNSRGERKGGRVCGSWSEFSIKEGAGEVSEQNEVDIITRPSNIVGVNERG